LDGGLPNVWVDEPCSSVCLQGEVRWEQREVRIMGRHVMQPRMVAYMADDPGLRYTYSGLSLVPDAWAPIVAEIKVQETQKLQTDRNGAEWAGSWCLGACGGRDQGPGTRSDRQTGRQAGRQTDRQADMTIHLHWRPPTGLAWTRHITSK
jgi:hypothetical protein